MSLSTWFRDYVYIPLGGNRVSTARWSLNILIVFLLSGVWHGANWTFLVWGLYHGILIIVERFLRGLRVVAGAAQPERISNWSRSLGVVRTFCLVTAGWVLFRASSLQVAQTVFYKVATDWESFLTPERVLHELAGFKWQTHDIAITLLAILAVELGDLLQAYVPVRDWWKQRPWALRWAGYYTLLLSIGFFGHFNGAPFIYFQF
jgi:D-alanyl-lipoteichoic acid acyltransferase DltB (MBOAT superfamily)